MSGQELGLLTTMYISIVLLIFLSILITNDAPKESFGLVVTFVVAVSFCLSFAGVFSQLDAMRKTKTLHGTWSPGETATVVRDGKEETIPLPIAPEQTQEKEGTE